MVYFGSVGFACLDLLIQPEKHFAWDHVKPSLLRPKFAEQSIVWFVSV